MLRVPVLHTDVQSLPYRGQGALVSASPVVDFLHGQYFALPEQVYSGHEPKLRIREPIELRGRAMRFPKSEIRCPTFFVWLILWTHYLLQHREAVRTAPTAFTSAGNGMCDWEDPMYVSVFSPVLVQSYHQ